MAFRYFLTSAAVGLTFPVVWVALGFLLAPVGIGIVMLMLGTPVLSGAYPFLAAGTARSPYFATLVGAGLTVVQWFIVAAVVSAISNELQLRYLGATVLTLVAIVICALIGHVAFFALEIPLGGFHVYT